MNTYSIFPVSPGENDRHGQAKKQSSHKKIFKDCATMTQAKSDSAEEDRSDNSKGRSTWESGTQ
jgi:hypothetical protein